MSQIAIVGAGYVGLTTGACFAHLGHQVIVADIDADRIARLERASISGVPKLVDSLIGRDTEVHRSGQRPKATRLMIGDHCSIDLE